MNELTFNQHADTETPQLSSQYVNGPRLLEILFPPECRPTMRWLRDQQKARRIPFIKLGRLVFFCPAAVRAALENKYR
jgi:uncharacterized protein YbaR (Trm112 family)